MIRLECYEYFKKRVFALPLIMHIKTDRNIYSFGRLTSEENRYEKLLHLPAYVAQQSCKFILNLPLVVKL